MLGSVVGQGRLNAGVGGGTREIECWGWWWDKGGGVSGVGGRTREFQC